MAKFKDIWKGLFEKPGASTHTAKWDRCVEHVKANGKGVNAYAVCTAMLGDESFKSIESDADFMQKMDEYMTTLGIKLKQKSVDTSFAGATPKSLLARQDLETKEKVMLIAKHLYDSGVKVEDVMTELRAMLPFTVLQEEAIMNALGKTIQKSSKKAKDLKPGDKIVVYGNSYKVADVTIEYGEKIVYVTFSDGQQVDLELNDTVIIKSEVQKSSRVYGEKRLTEDEAFADLTLLVNANKGHVLQAYVDYDEKDGVHYACVTLGDMAVVKAMNEKPKYKVGDRVRYQKDVWIVVSIISAYGSHKYIIDNPGEDKEITVDESMISKGQVEQTGKGIFKVQGEMSRGEIVHEIDLLEDKLKFTTNKDKELQIRREIAELKEQLRTAKGQVEQTGKELKEAAEEALDADTKHEVKSVVDNIKSAQLKRQSAVINAREAKNKSFKETWDSLKNKKSK